MSDYLFSSSPFVANSLGQALAGIYEHNPPEVLEFHGEWGSLAVSLGHYHGFRPYESDTHILVVVGGPVLYFRDNTFLVAGDSFEATRAIYQRWLVEGIIRWDEDLSGPFTLLLVDKQAGQVQVVTDLMAFIPVFRCINEGNCYLGTHVDALARISGKAGNYDWVSLTDFVLNDVVTYPYSAYEAIRQCPPGSVIEFGQDEYEERAYWQPHESETYGSLKAAAWDLHKGLKGYVERVTAGMEHVAQFISAGEDSRALAGMLPTTLPRDAFIFLDRMNREGRIAQRVAEVYGEDFHVGYRSRTHYLDILPEASVLVGLGHQYMHAHSLRFDKQYGLAGYQAVFGGFLSDTLLKGVHVRLFKGYGKLPFLPQLKRRGYSPPGARFGRLGAFLVLSGKVRERQAERLEEVRRFRPTTAEEWFHFYPCSMHNDMPNLYVTRRLFKSYEPFMCKEAVKVGAAVPTSWKLNRRLFQRATQPFLRQSKWILHADGRLPYFGWWANVPVQFAVWLWRGLGKWLSSSGVNQGPWNEWRAVFRDPAWQRAAEHYTEGLDLDGFLASGVGARELLVSDKLTNTQMANLMQLVATLSATNPRSYLWDWNALQAAVEGD